MLHLQRPSMLAAMLAMTIASSALSVAATGSGKIDYNRDIRALLSDRCFACHGPDRRSEMSQSTDLRLDDRESATGSGAIVPGKSDESMLLERITTDDESLRMPPAEAHKAPFTAQEVALLKAWIDQGAEYQPLWSLVPPQRPETPAVQDSNWARTPLDRFVLARLESEGLKPAPEADRATLIRRVTFDLTGLPPTLDEIRDFEQDAAATPKALERVADRLLAPPAYGEHLAAEWLQLARFADSNGYQNDFRRDMSVWRDWVIEALNRNMPYDQFVLQQTAGDLLPSPTLDQLIATGFHRNNRTVTEAGSIDEEWRVENNIDRVETTGAAFLGLTIGCARCHDHKYDSISQEEFYSFYAFFNSIDEQGVYTEQPGNVPPLVQAPRPSDTARLAALDEQIRQAEQEVESLLQPKIDATLQQLQADAAAAQLPPPRWTLPLAGTFDVTSSAPSDKSVQAHYKGDSAAWGEGVPGQALQLQGEPASHVELARTSPVDRDTPFAFSVWIRPQQGEGAIVSQMDDGNHYQGWDTILLPDRRLKIHLIHRWDSDAIAVVTSEPVGQGTWCHLAVSYDGSSHASGVQVYLNGRPMELQVQEDRLQHSLASGQPVRIGRRSSGLHFKGGITLFRWFDQSLDSSAAAALFAADLSSTEGWMVAKWPAERRKFLQDLAIRQQGTMDGSAEASLVKLREERKQLEQAIPTVMILKDRPEPRPTYVLQRGVYDAPDTTRALEPNVPAMLPPLPSDLPRNRMALAKWLIDPQHPLVARVQVNRIWQRMFGRGIVASTDNFGVQGDAPTHPELLDWLTTEFVASGWDVKQLHRTIALSATYQQSSAILPAAYERDPQNLLLARGVRFRLSAEQIRDHALATAGLLVNKIGGPSVKPYQPDGLWAELAGGAGEGPYVLSEADDLYRRSLYTNRKRTVPHPTLGTFDAPSFEICQASRLATNTPLQALALLNDTTYVEAARALAGRMLGRTGETPAARLAFGFQLATGRPPRDGELRVLEAALEQHLQHFKSNEAEADKLLAHGQLAVDPSMEVGELAAYTTVASTLLNLDETITRR